MSERLLKSTAIVSLMTFLSRILGFVRDIVIARMFGAGVGADVFFVAFKIPNFLRRLFAEGAFSQAFIPVLAEYKELGEKPLRQLIAQTTGTLGVILMAVTAIGIFASPLLIMAFAPGFSTDPQKYQLATELLRITFPYLLFISLTALAGAILNSFSRFAVPAFTPVFLNLSLIGGALFLSPIMDEPVKALAWGVFVGGIVQLLFQLPFLLGIKKLPRPRWGWKSDGVRKITRLMLPAMFGVSVSQINLLIDTLLASLLVTGSISWLYYSDRLVEFPLGVFGIALSTVILPSLSKKHANQSTVAFSHTIDWALRWVFLISTPAALGLMILAEPLLLTLFQYGAFSVSDAHNASLSLIAYGAGLLPFVLIKVLAPGYFARQDTKTPVKIGVIAMISNMLLNIILMQFLAHAGLALATSLSALLNAGLLYLGLRKKQVYTPNRGWLLFFLRLSIANLGLLAFLLYFNADSSVWAGWTATQRYQQLILLIAVAIIVYFVLLRLMGIRLKTILRPLTS